MNNETPVCNGKASKEVMLKHDCDNAPVFRDDFGGIWCAECYETFIKGISLTNLDNVIKGKFE